MKKAAPPPPQPPALKPLVPNGALHEQGLNGGQRPPLSTPGEDCAIDELLEGRMDLEVILPDLKVVKMNVDRRTPMMDLLVQATTANKISPGGHVINVISKDERNVHYKPNTPIGSLDANAVYIVPKSTIDLPIKRMPKLANQPFEQTFRLQVNLPRNQRTVLRVSPRITLAELKNQICSDKELDQNSHHLVHPAQPDTVLDLNATLEVYGCAEISLMSNSGLRDSIRSTSTNIYPYQKAEEEKRKKGILRLFSRKKKDTHIEASTNGVNNGLSPSRSESSTLNRNSYQPKQSIKRKPAPAPPPVIYSSSPPLITQSTSSVNSRPESEISLKTDEIESTVSHSRHSSDSSGYHEPSIFSDCSENKSPEASIVHGDHGLSGQDSPLHKDHPDSSVLLKRTSMTTKESTNLKNVPSCSNASLVSASRKRKAPLPPAPTLPAIESPSSTESSPLFEATDEPLFNDFEPAAEQLVVALHDEDCIRAEEVTDMQETNQQETEAIQYLEDVLQQSEIASKYSSLQNMVDDSDTDSQKDEGEVISVCQAEVHANDNDQDASKSAEDLQTFSNQVPVQSSTIALANPVSQLAGNEVVDSPAEDSGISTSLNSDADSSLPSINSDLKAVFDFDYHEDIYCNVTDLDTHSVPLKEELPAQLNPEVHSDAIDVERASLEKDTDLKTPDVPEKSEDTAVLSVEENTDERNFEISSTHFSTNTNSNITSEITSDSLPLTQSFELSVKQKVVSSSEDFKVPEPPLPQAQTVSNKNTECQTSDANPNNAGSQQSTSNATPQNRRKLENFVLGCYKSESRDIYSLPDQDTDVLKQGATLEIKTNTNTLTRKNRELPAVKIVPFSSRNEKEDPKPVENSVTIQEKCAQLSSMSTLPLTGRSSSLYNLTRHKKVEKSVTLDSKDEVIVNESMKRTQSDQNVPQEISAAQQKAEFIKEQKRLQEEYQRLQEQFIMWQKQLLNNQNLLQNEQIIPHMPFSPFTGFQSAPDLPTSAETGTHPANSILETHENASIDELKTRSLPRPKTRPLSLKETHKSEPSIIENCASEDSAIPTDARAEEKTNRPESLTSCSVNTQVSLNHEDKVTQVPSPPETTTSGTQVPSPESDNQPTAIGPKTSNTKTQVPSPDSDSNDSNKSQTLPRPKPKPASALLPSRTMTLNRDPRPKAPIVSVTIGSWQQRGSQTAISDIEPFSVASSRSKFQSLEHIPQTFSKPAPIIGSMEKRKLPPVPNASLTVEITGESSKKNHGTAKEDSSTSKSKETGKLIPKRPSNEKPKAEHTEKPSTSTVPKEIEAGEQRQKVEAKTGTVHTHKPSKPIVRLSSMKDESHFHIKGLRKWPLTEINESSIMMDGQHTIVEDLRTSSKKPGGYVQEKVRRAEVDLRKPKPTKTETLTSTKAKEAPTETSKLHITKVNITSKKSDSTPHEVDSKNTNHAISKATTPVTAPSSSAQWSNTLPKSKSLNTELKSIFSKRASVDAESKRASSGAHGNSSKVSNHQIITVNGVTQPPPPPPPMPSVSTMPTIPPAEQIPVSSQLLIAGGRKATSKEAKRGAKAAAQSKDPREELMLEIRGFGGKKALKKAAVAQSGWHLKVFGSSSTVNS